MEGDLGEAPVRFEPGQGGARLGQSGVEGVPDQGQGPLPVEGRLFGPGRLGVGLRQEGVHQGAHVRSVQGGRIGRGGDPAVVDLLQDPVQHVPRMRSRRKVGAGRFLAAVVVLPAGSCRRTKEGPLPLRSWPGGR